MEKIIDKDEMVLNIINMVSTITEDNQIINDIKQILYMNFRSEERRVGKECL